MKTIAPAAAGISARTSKFKAMAGVDRVERRDRDLRPGFAVLHAPALPTTIDRFASAS